MKNKATERLGDFLVIAPGPDPGPITLQGQISFLYNAVCITA